MGVFGGQGSVFNGISPYDERRHPQAIIESMSKGLGVPAFCAQEMICEDTFYRWVKRHPNFAEAYKVGKMLKKSYYEHRLTESIADKELNLPAIVAAATMIGGMSRERPVPALKAGLTPREHYECIIKEVESGALTPKEAKTLGEVIMMGINIVEHTEHEARITALEIEAGIRDASEKSNQAFEGGEQADAPEESDD